MKFYISFWCQDTFFRWVAQWHYLRLIALQCYRPDGGSFPHICRWFTEPFRWMSVVIVEREGKKNSQSYEKQHSKGTENELFCFSQWILRLSPGVDSFLLTWPLGGWSIIELLDGGQWPVGSTARQNKTTSRGRTSVNQRARLLLAGQRSLVATLQGKWRETTCRRLLV